MMMTLSCCAPVRPPVMLTSSTNDCPLLLQTQPCTPTTIVPRTVPLQRKARERDRLPHRRRRHLRHRGPPRPPQLQGAHLPPPGRRLRGPLQHGRQLLPGHLRARAAGGRPRSAHRHLQAPVLDDAKVLHQGLGVLRLLGAAAVQPPAEHLPAGGDERHGPFG